MQEVIQVNQEIPNPVAPYVETNPVSVVLDANLRTRFFAEIEAAVSEFEPNLTTKKGRDEVASFAYKIARTKTAIDEAGKKLNEDARKQIGVVDAARKEARDTLDKLRDLARKPLDEWEAKEAARKAKIKEVTEFLDRCRIILATDTSEEIASRIDGVKAVDGDEFADAKASTLECLTAAHARIVQEELDRAELAKLRAAEEERQRVEAEKAAEEQRAKAEAERIAREEQATKDRIAAAEKRAAEEATAKAQAEAERLAAEERAKAQAEIDRVNSEKRKLEQAEADRVAAEKKAADEAEARAKDREHRSKVMCAAKTAIMDATKIDEATAKAIVLAIVGGSIPNVSIKF